MLHLAQTDELALASVHDRFAESLDVLAGGLTGRVTVDDGAPAALVARERRTPNSALLERWRTARGLVARRARGEVIRRRVTWVAGQLSTQTLATARLAECWIHTGDVAEAIGIVQEPTDRLVHVARLAWRTLPYAFQRDGREMSGPVRVRPARAERWRWQFVPDVQPATIIDGLGADLCLVAASRHRRGHVAAAPDPARSPRARADMRVTRRGARRASGDTVIAGNARRGGWE